MADTFDSWHLDDWLSHLEAIHPAEIELGLSRVRKVAERLDVLTPAKLTLLVGGTNGKGTTSALLCALLSAQGLRVGAYTSPHIERYNERVSINGAHINDDDLCHAFRSVERARADIPLTYFEFGTLAALVHFKTQSCDVAVLEIGLGGRLDAVNIVNADASVVTSIGLDHQDWLGDSLDDIAYEKCSIARQGKPFVFGQPSVDSGADLNDGLDANISANKKAKQTVSAIGATWLGRGEQFDAEFTDGGLQVRVSEHGQARTWALPAPNVPYHNVASALQLLAAVNRLPSDDVIKRVVGDLVVAGRMQSTTFALDNNQGSIRLSLDVGHNPQAAAFLAERWPAVDGIVLGMLSDKDTHAVLAAMPRTRALWLVGLDVPRGLSAKQLHQRCLSFIDRPGAPIDNQEGAVFESSSRTFESVAQAFTQLKQHANANEHWLVMGSFYTVQQALACVQTPLSAQ